MSPPDDVVYTLSAENADNRAELDAMLAEIVGPIRRDIAANEVALGEVYRPMIAEVGVEAEAIDRELGPIVSAKVQPIRAGISTTNYDLALIGGALGVDPRQITVGPDGKPIPLPMPPAPAPTPAPTPTTTGECRTTTGECPDPSMLPDGIICRDGRMYLKGGGFYESDDGQPIGGSLNWTEWNTGPWLCGDGSEPRCYTFRGEKIWACPVPGLPAPPPGPGDRLPPDLPPADLPPDDEGGSKCPAPLPPAPVPPQPPPVPVPVPEPEPRPDRGLLDPWNPCDPTFAAQLRYMIDELARIGSELVHAHPGAIVAVPDLVHSAREGISALGRWWNGVVSALPKFVPLGDDDMFDALKSPGVLASIDTHLEKLESTLRVYTDWVKDPWVIKQQGRKEALVGAWAVRAVFAAFQDTSWGWEFGPQALTNIRIVYTQIDVILNHIIEYIWPVRISDMPDIDSMYLTNGISEEHTRMLVELHGYDWVCKLKALYARRTQPTEDQLSQLRLIGAITPQQWLEGMRKKGWLDKEDIEKYDSTLAFIPPPSDAIRFAVKDVFDPGKLGRAEMEEELRQQKGLMEALAAVGIRKTTIAPEGYEPLEYDIPLAYWLASFEEASPTQVYAGLQRLRPNRVERYRQLATDAELAANPALKAGATVTPGPRPGTKWITPLPVTINTVNKLLKEKDYNPIWRGMLAAISYRVTGRTDTKRFYKYKAFGEPLFTKGFAGKPGVNLEATGVAEREMYESFMDQGYSPSDAIVHAYSVAAELEQSRDLMRLKQERGLVCGAYTEGVYDRAKAVEVLVQTGLPKDQAESQMALCDSKAGMAYLRKIKASVRKGYMRGQYDDAAARAMLTQAGVTRRVVDQSMRLWALDRDASSREVKAQEMCGWVADGTMTYAQMQTRLLNLGYRPDDVVRIVRHCQLGHLAKSSKERERLLAAQAKERERVAAADQRQRDRAARLQRQAIRDWLALQTEKNLQKWRQACLITDEAIRQAMAAKGVSPEDVERLLASWDGATECEEGGDDVADG